MNIDLTINASKLIEEAIDEIQLHVALSELEAYDTVGISFEEGNAITMNIRHGVEIKPEVIS